MTSRGEIMNEKLQEHIYKEALKRIVDNSSNCPDRIKNDIKTIIEAGKSPEEILEATLTYLATIRWF